MWPKLFLFVFGLTAVTSRCINFLRQDYVYKEDYDAYYKLHWDPNKNSWDAAFLTCDEEDAMLFYPQSFEEWTVINNLAETANLALNVSDVFVGIHDKFGTNTFVTIDGQMPTIPIENEDMAREEGKLCVTMNRDGGKFSTINCLTDEKIVRPFVCKKVVNNIDSCPTTDKEYKYVKEVNKCYKVNNKLKNWSVAMISCLMEGGKLLLITSDAEAAIVQRMTGYKNYYVGIRKLPPFNKFYTITGQKPKDVGFEKWYDEYALNENESDNDCISVFRNDNNYAMYYRATNCLSELPYICEMNASI